MNLNDLAFQPALKQAQLIQSGEISPLALTELYLSRIETLNPQLGSYFTVMAEAAIAEAKAKTERLAQGDCTELPRFFGVPISIKDLNSVAGAPCSYGIRFARDRIASQDDPLVQRIRQAGFVILGKTATSQLGSFPYTEPPGFPPARNPWNLEYTPGGSSGGAAAALAAGLCAISQGSDGGGSLRGPAFCCGLVGLKPSRGRVSFAPVGERLNGLASNGPLGRTVADAAALLDVMSGYVLGDPYWLSDPEPSFLDWTQRSPGQLRIGYFTALDPIGAAHPVCQQAVLDTAKRLEALGHVVEETCRPDFSDLIEPFTVVWQCVLAEANVPWFALERVNRWLLGRAKRTNSGAYLRAVSQLQVVARQIVKFCQPYDVLLLPVCMEPAVKVGQWRQLRSARVLDNIIHWIAPCPPFNASGQPALSLPAGFDPNGVPVGVQLVGRPAAETTLLALAAQLEAAHPWIQHRPAIAQL
ncbi:MAG: amidase [Leptolyngbyaceae cyanobacterium SM1_1_3]|nr:amidase [Leptolyngbyaceae cyanobacterium SM1_1_3]NJN01350.1 amidase [Leptolyngbyaceae cyanobacterium RM1_1_2]NJO10702.1 amidase [Leptolyngbyaceae cyanobacterium SL_1_1]